MVTVIHVLTIWAAWDAFLVLLVLAAAFANKDQGNGGPE